MTIEEGSSGDFSPYDPEQEFSSAIEIRGKITRLTEGEEFRWFLARQQERLDALTREAFGGIESLDGAVKMINTNGKVSGFLEAMNFYQALLSGAENVIATYEMYQRKEKENGAGE